MFADLVRADGNLRVADLGCGPGRVSDYLASLGLDTVGVDLSPRMIEIARRSYPSLRFEVGSVTALDLPDGQLGGVIAWFSIFHTPADELPTVFGEFHRVLAPGGQLLVATHSGDGLEAPEQAYGHPVSYELHLRRSPACQHCWPQRASRSRPRCTSRTPPSPAGPSASWWRRRTRGAQPGRW